MARYFKTIDRNADKADLDNLFKETGARYSLLNYAAAVAEVLAEISLLSKKSPGFKRSDIRDKCKKIEELVMDCRRLANEPVIKFFGNTAAQLKSQSKALGELLEKFKNQAEWAMDFSLFTGLVKKARPIKKTNQIAMLWIPGMVDEGKYIRWEELIELMYWFKTHLPGTSYSNEITPDKMNKKAIQTLYTKTKRKEDLAMIFSTAFQGVPHVWENRPMVLLSQPGAGTRAFPINSIEFYTDRILTFFDFEKEHLARETVFKKGRPATSIRYAHASSKFKSSDYNLVLTI